jgi:hypothetical protein
LAISIRKVPAGYLFLEEAEEIRTPGDAEKLPGAWMAFSTLVLTPSLNGSIPRRFFANSASTSRGEYPNFHWMLFIISKYFFG